MYGAQTIFLERFRLAWRLCIRDEQEREGCETGGFRSDTHDLKAMHTAHRNRIRLVDQIHNGTDDLVSHEDIPGDHDRAQEGDQGATDKLIAAWPAHLAHLRHDFLEVFTNPRHNMWGVCEAVFSNDSPGSKENTPYRLHGRQDLNPQPAVLETAALPN